MLNTDHNMKKLLVLASIADSLVEIVKAQKIQAKLAKRELERLEAENADTAELR